MNARRLYRMASVTLLATAVVAVVSLHILSPGLDPRSRRLSEYANGPFGLLMTIAFIALGVALLLLAADMRRPVTCRWRPPMAPVGIAVAGVGMIVSGIFPTDPGPAGSAREAIHSQASGSASVALIVTSSAWALLGRRRDRTGWLPSAPAASLAALALVAGVASPWLHDTSWTGLSQRIVWLALVGWLVVASWPRRRPAVSAQNAGTTVVLAASAAAQRARAP